MTIDCAEAPVQPLPNAAQATFLAAVDAAKTGAATNTNLRLSGGPGTGKSFSIARAAIKAAEDGWTVFLVGPTHQATGVLAAAVPAAFPFEPDPKAMLQGGDIMFCTAHRLGAWVQKSRSRGAAAGEVDPVPRDSWLGRSFRPSWDHPPTGVMVIADETSMYPGQMVAALRSTLASLHRECGRLIFVAVGDPDQLTPVRGRHYEYLPGEHAESPSVLVTDRGFMDFKLDHNVRAKSPELRNVVETYLRYRRVPVPQTGPGEGIYGWAEANDEFWAQWADMVDRSGTANCVLLGSRRASVAYANDMMCQLIDEVSAADLTADRKMRVQETYSPTGLTLAASSDLLTVKEIEETDDILSLILPPERGHAAAHHADVLAAVRRIIEDDANANGKWPVVSVEVHGVRAGILRRRPAMVATEHDTLSASASRWAVLENQISYAAFRQASEVHMRRGLASIYYHLADAAKLKLEAPYAMTSHRAQGSTYPHVGVLADSPPGGMIVDHRIESARNASTYVMLSRASASLTVIWKPAHRPTPTSLFAF